MNQPRAPKEGSGQEVRAAAARGLVPVLTDRGSLAGLDEHSVIARDRSLLKELCYGTCRRLPRLEALANQLLKQPLKNATATSRPCYWWVFINYSICASPPMQR